MSRYVASSRSPCTRSSVFALMSAMVSLCSCDLLVGLGEGEGKGEGDLVVRTPFPCGVNRTDALHVDPGTGLTDDVVWAGCGTNTVGTGLYRSVDGGGSWAAFEPGNAPDVFDDFRVNSISRSADGHLYVAGTGGGHMVLRIDGDTDEVDIVLDAGNTVGTSFSVGHFRRDRSGRALAESLTGTDALVRASDDDDFVPADLFGGASHQILDLTLETRGDEDIFVAVGSTITENNLLFTENSVAPPLSFDVVDLSGNDGLGFSGELRAVAAADGIILAGGVNEDADIAVFHVVTDTEVNTFRVEDIIPDLERGTVRGACAAPGHHVVVGEESITNGLGFVLHSVDGVAWEDITGVAGPGPLHRCVIVEDRLYVAGADGLVASGAF